MVRYRRQSSKKSRAADGNLAGRLLIERSKDAALRDIRGDRWGSLEIALKDNLLCM